MKQLCGLGSKTAPAREEKNMTKINDLQKLCHFLLSYAALKALNLLWEADIGPPQKYIKLQLWVFGPFSAT